MEVGFAVDLDTDALLPVGLLLLVSFFVLLQVVVLPLFFDVRPLFFDVRPLLVGAVPLLDVVLLWLSIRLFLDRSPVFAVLENALHCPLMPKLLLSQERSQSLSNCLKVKEALAGVLAEKEW